MLPYDTEIPTPGSSNPGSSSSVFSNSASQDPSLSTSGSNRSERSNTPDTTTSKEDKSRDFRSFLHYARHFIKPAVFETNFGRIKYYSEILSYLIAIATVAMLAHQILAYYETKLQLSDTVAVLKNRSQVTASQPKNVSKIDLRMFVDRNPFALKSDSNKQQTGSEPKSSNSNKPLAVTLVGTYTGKPSYAILEDTKKQDQLVVTVGEQFLELGKITRIGNEEVELQWDGRSEILKLNHNLATTTSTTASDQTTELAVAESDVDQALSNLSKTLTEIRGVPYFRDGKPYGLRVFAIQRGSLFEKVGLQNGDILTSINGNDLSDPTQAIMLFEKLKTERKIRLDLERNQDKKSFSYSVQ